MSDLVVRVLSALSLTAVFIAQAQAGLITQAVSVSTPGGDDPFGLGSDHLIDQSGLSANYISGVTDFSSFTATTTATVNSPWSEATALGGAAGATPDFIFDLGSVISIDGVALWNQLGGGSVLTYDIFGSVDGVGYSFFGSGSALDGGVDVPAYTSSWTAASAQYVKLSVTSNNGSPSATRFNEIAFSQTVPIPSTLFLLGLGLLGLRVSRQRPSNGVNPSPLCT